MSTGSLAVMIPAVEPRQPGPAPHARPGRAALVGHWQRAVCAALLVVMAAWELAGIPVKAWLVTHVSLSSVLTTDPVALVGLGAKAAFNHHRAEWLPLIWLLASISTLKWHLVAFWAGTLWGRDILHHWSGTSPQHQRTVLFVDRLVARWPVVAIVLAYVLMPLSSLIYATVGAAELSWRTLLKVDLAAAAVTTFAWIYLGYFIGRPAERALASYSHIATWVALGLAVVILAYAVWRYRTRETRRIKAEVRAESRRIVAERLAAAKQARDEARRLRPAGRLRDRRSPRRPWR